MPSGGVPFPCPGVIVELLDVSEVPGVIARGPASQALVMLVKSMGWILTDADIKSQSGRTPRNINEKGLSETLDTAVKMERARHL